MPVRVKKNRKPRTPKVSMKQKQSVKVNVHVGSKPRRSGLEKVAQQPRHPQPSFSFVTNVQPSNDTSLLYRELFDTKAKVAQLERRNPFEMALANQAAAGDRAFQAQQLRADESKPFRGKLAEQFPAERLGVDVGTSPQFIGTDTPIQNQGVMGFSQDARPTPELIVAEKRRRKNRRVKEEAVTEQAVSHFKDPYNTVERSLRKASTSGHEYSDESPRPATLEEAERMRGIEKLIAEQSIAERLAQIYKSNASAPIASPDHKRATQKLSDVDLPLDPLRTTIMGGGELLSQQREPVLHTPAGQVYVSPRDEGLGALDRAAARQGEGMLGEQAAQERADTGDLEASAERTATGAPKVGAPKIYRTPAQHEQNRKDIVARNKKMAEAKAHYLQRQKSKGLTALKALIPTE